MITVVRHALNAGQGILPSGTVVDSSNWLHELLLLQQRTLRVATSEEQAAFEGGSTELLPRRTRRSL